MVEKSDNRVFMGVVGLIVTLVFSLGGLSLSIIYATAKLTTSFNNIYYQHKEIMDAIGKICK